SGPDSRVKEVMGTTLTKLREGGKVSGLPKLGEIIGADHAERVRRLAKEVESLSGYTPEVVRHMEGSETSATLTAPSYHDEEIVSTLPPEERNPMEERISSWAARSEEHTSELQSRFDLVCRLLLETTKAAASNLLGLVKSGHPRDIDNLPAVARVGWAAVRT